MSRKVASLSRLWTVPLTTHILMVLVTQGARREPHSPVRDHNMRLVSVQQIPPETLLQQTDQLLLLTPPLKKRVEKTGRGKRAVLTWGQSPPNNAKP